MIDTIYLEHSISDHPRAKDICSKFKNARVLNIDKYPEIFNVKRQSFRLQKKNPSLILAKKSGKLVLPAPKGFGIGGVKNFYFSHMYNCLYDCDYCFLQGMYSSSNYIIFVNYEDYMHAIIKESQKDLNVKKTFFSGYDCDSLAFEKVTGFANFFIKKFSFLTDCEIELRTKSANVEIFQEREPVSNCIIAFSLSPYLTARSLDTKAPSVKRRIEVMKILSDLGWKIGLRFDPLIFSRDWKKLYEELFLDCLNTLKVTNIHSISFGPLRFPKKVFKKIKSDRPEDMLFIGQFDLYGGTVSYNKTLEEEMMNFCKGFFLNHIDEKKIFYCVSEVS